MSDNIVIEKVNLKKIFNNNYTIIFSILFVLSALLVLLRGPLSSTSVSFFAKIYSAFSTEILIILALAFALSAICAYFNKFKWMFIPILIWILITTVAIRTSNIGQLKDVTTGDYTLGPDLDPFLYLRHAQEILDGRLQKIDYMRQAPLGAENYALTNLMPWGILVVYKIMSVFSDTSLTYAAIISPVIFFVISLIGFFLFTYNILSFKIPKEISLIGAIIASLFYTFIPQMLHRTLAGIPEIESLGMIFFWFALLFFTLAWKNEKTKKIIFLGVLAGLFTAGMIWTWGGNKYIYISLSLTTLVLFLFENDRKKNFLIFTSWAIPTLLFEFIKSKSLVTVATDLTSSGGAVFVLIVLCADIIFDKIKLKERLKVSKIKIPDPVKSLLMLILIGSIILLILDPGFFIGFIKSFINGLLHPFGGGRIGSTVAENKTPYLQEALGNFGKLIWLFLLGAALLFYNATKKFKKKEKIILNLLFIIFLTGIIFSRISPSNIFNGDNFISLCLYIGGILVFGLGVLIIYIKSFLKNDERNIQDFKEINVSYILLLSLAFLAVVSLRGAIRLFFIISPILILGATFLITKFFENFKESKKETRWWWAIVILVIAIVAGNILANYSYQTANEARGTIPSSYEQQWQKAMAWVRENAIERGIFVHWWDYGYWIQTLGERPTVTDGGHINGWWVHTTARYLMTTPRPETALSLMKTYNVSYLLFDSTDLGKYSAYSSIGSDASNNDRLSWIPVMISDPKQTQETTNSTLRTYQGGFILDEDIIYNDGQKEIFLPQNKAAMIGIILETTLEKNQNAIKQPIGVYIYNNQQFRIPIRYLYFEKQLLDFKNGLNITLRVIPSLIQNQNGVKIDNLGSIIYLSPRTKDSAFAKLYLMDDPLKEYPTIKLAYTQSDQVVESLKSQGANFGEFLYYQGFRGPIKIWKVDYPENVLEREEFLRNYGKYGELDNLEFTK